jgi:Cu+-exporting ATPase
VNRKFNVSGMTCSACSAAVDRSVRKLEGVSDVNVNLLTNSMTVEYDDKIVEPDKIIQAVEEAGYNASLYTAEVKPLKDVKPLNSVKEQIKGMKQRLAVSFVFLIPLMVISMGHMVGIPLPMWLHGTGNAVNFAFLQLLLTLPIVYVNRKYYQTGFKTLFRGSPNMDSLIAIGSSAAIIYGIFAIFRIGYGLGHNQPDIVEKYKNDLYFETAAMILALITLGKFLEAGSKGKTSEAIEKLMDLAPKTAIIIRDGKETEIPVENVKKGDIVVVKPGGRIPVDGVIVEGSSSVDQSALTGESIPVEKHAGDKVFAATINKSGYFKFSAEKVGSDTTLAQIIRLVEEAASSKAPISKLADKISGIFVPAVIGISLISAVIWLMAGESFEFALSVGISVLVISCPCALGLATPVAIMVGTGAGASNGILIKSAEALETVHAIDTVVLDKTGTITEGKPAVTDIVALNGMTGEELLLIAASIEKPSEHPLADAVVEKAYQAGLTLKNTDKFEAIPGRGIIAELDNKTYIAGNLAFMAERNILTDGISDISDTFAREGKTPLYFAEDKKLIGVIAAADTIKPTSYDAIEQFKEMNLDVVMLTGDNEKTAEAIRRKFNIDKVISDVLPQDKESVIGSIQQGGKKVAMIGDGINDAPALVRADVGIAIGAGTDIAIESADIVLVRNDLQSAVTAIQLSKATLRNIKQNLFWAFFYNTLGIPIAAGLLYPAFGLKLSPMFGAAAMSLSSVFVVTNALRLKFFRPKPVRAK